MSGEVKWRFCDRLSFASPVAVDHDALFAVAGDGSLVGRGGARLHHLDPWSGEVRWSVDVPAGAAAVGAPLLADETVILATSGRRGTGLIGFDRRTGDVTAVETLVAELSSREEEAAVARRIEQLATTFDFDALLAFADTLSQAALN